ncbi:MAG: CoA transferase [Deltaproteobacteria bacterium]|nr:CoA transferase [Deltaproteobacteria bacterium]
MTPKALEGVKVLEYADFVTGPYCTKLLADLGAAVIKIEIPGGGDPSRRRGPFPGDIPDRERSGLFLYLNTNKRSITLDPAVPMGRKIFTALVEWADILVEDHAPGAMEAMGISYDALRGFNPKLVMTSITPFGQTGPCSGDKAYGLNISHGAGSGYLTPVAEAEDDREPIKAGGFFDHCCSGLSAATATLLAFYRRKLSGDGEHIDISEQEASLAYDRVEVGIFANENFIVRRIHSGIGVALAPCRDGHIVFAATGNPLHWESLMAMMDHPVWAKEERFTDQASRFKYAREINDHLSKWTVNHTTEDLYRRLAQAGIPVGIVRSQSDLVEKDAQLKHREFFTGIDHPAAGELTYASAAYRFSETPWRLDRPAPTLGQHNDEVYGGILGYSREQQVKLRQMGIL